MTKSNDAAYRPPIAVEAYLTKRAASSQWQIVEPPVRRFRAAIVIPSLAESANLSLTLNSLSRNPPEYLAEYLILVVVNNRADASSLDKSDNLKTLQMLPEWKQEFGLKHLHWVDAASAGKELPPKQGVGLARKIGLDLGLTCLDYSGGDPLLICLDADTVVQDNYLEAISLHFGNASAGGASMNYRHQLTCDPAGQAAIDRYELFLRAYVLGLELAGSPYAFHTVGSAMACRASAYTASGGMNKRLAGEDFYFLQQLHKVAGVSNLRGTTVFPSPRASQRVPFGTGRAVGDMLARGGEQLMFYQPQLFDFLGRWQRIVSENVANDAGVLICKSAGISPVMSDYLVQAGFEGAWDNMRKHNPDGARLMVAFHSWFDAFRTMRMMHHLTDNGYPRIEPEEAVPPLLQRAGQPLFTTVSGMLERLRTMQG